MVIPDEAIILVIVVLDGLMIFYILDLRIVNKNLQQRLTRETEWSHKCYMKMVKMRNKYERLKEDMMTNYKKVPMPSIHESISEGTTITWNGKTYKTREEAIKDRQRYIDKMNETSIKCLICGKEIKPRSPGVYICFNCGMKYLGEDTRK